jgi:hypothetical protein
VSVVYNRGFSPRVLSELIAVIELHREEIDEDISIAGLIAGLGDQTNAHKTAA